MSTYLSPSIGFSNNFNSQSLKHSQFTINHRPSSSFNTSNSIPSNTSYVYPTSINMNFQNKPINYETI
jgi:hypothetical protein